MCEVQPELLAPISKFTMSFEEALFETPRIRLVIPATMCDCRRPRCYFVGNLHEFAHILNKEHKGSGQYNYVLHRHVRREHSVFRVCLDERKVIFKKVAVSIRCTTALANIRLSNVAWEALVNAARASHNRQVVTCSSSLCSQS